MITLCSSSPATAQAWSPDGKRFAISVSSPTPCVLIYDVAADFELIECIKLYFSPRNLDIAAFKHSARGEAYLLAVAGAQGVELHWLPYSEDHVPVTLEQSYSFCALTFSNATHADPQNSFLALAALTGHIGQCSHSHVLPERMMFL